MKRLKVISTNVGLLLGVSIISFFTQKIIIFAVLGTIVLMLFNLHINLGDFIKK